MPARTGSVLLVYTHAPLAERVISGFCIMGTSDTGEPILGSVELYITEDDYNGMPHDNTFIWFSKFAAWASNPLQGKQGPPMPRLQRQYFSRFFPIKRDIAHRWLKT